MSLRATLELVVQIDRLQNVDLWQQGLYQLRVTVYHYSADGSKVPFAV